MADIKKIIEDLNSILEDELVDEFDMESVELDAKPIHPEDISLTDELDAKTKISRALDNFKKALEEFKSATVAEIDLIKDSNIIDAMGCLTNCCSDIENALSGKNEIKNQMELDLVEEPEEQEVEEDNSTEAVEMEPESEETEQVEDEEDFSTFEEEAEFDLFN